MNCSVPDSLSLADKITINKLSVPVITFTNVLPCNTHKDTIQFTIKYLNLQIVEMQYTFVLIFQQS